MLSQPRFSLIFYLVFVKQLLDFLVGRHNDLLVPCHLLPASFKQVSQILQGPFVLTLECKILIETTPPGADGHHQLVIHVLRNRDQHSLSPDSSPAFHCLALPGPTNHGSTFRCAAHRASAHVSQLPASLRSLTWKTFFKKR